LARSAWAEQHERLVGAPAVRYDARNGARKPRLLIHIGELAHKHCASEGLADRRDWVGN
jgi:hypothetical protein